MGIGDWPTRSIHFVEALRKEEPTIMLIGIEVAMFAMICAPDVR